MSRTLQAGFVPLIDAAPLIVASERGFAASEGIVLKLIRQASWASLRDHLNLGYIDCAQALAPLPIAASLGIGQVRASLVVPFVLSRGGNAITLSTGLSNEIRAANGSSSPCDARGWARALSIAIRQRQEPVTLAMVYPFSGHNFELRYWLAAAGIHPDRDVRLVAIPPPLMVESLRANQIDGFCVGEPWNSKAAAEGIGEIVATKSEIFPHGIEKVLALPTELLVDDATTSALLRALAAAAEWCDQSANHGSLAELLARPEYLGTDPELNLNVLSGNLPIVGQAVDPDFIYFSRLDANRPRKEDALWLYAQMLRWGQVAASAEAEASAQEVFRPDVYAKALNAEVITTLCTISACDRVPFDGRPISEYLKLFDFSTPYGTRISDH
jgi:ABC-type nitrate/sulfonate/bicarbonate transport system substrate-binding protein